MLCYLEKQSIAQRAKKEEKQNFLLSERVFMTICLNRPYRCHYGNN